MAVLAALRHGVACGAQLPQITVQSINNTLLDSWAGFAIASIAVSGFVAADAL